MVKRFKQHPRFSRGTMKISMLDPDENREISVSVGPDTILEGDKWERMCLPEMGMLLVPVVEPAEAPKAKPRPAAAAPAPTMPEPKPARDPEMQRKSLTDTLADGFAKMHADNNPPLPPADNGSAEGKDPGAAAKAAAKAEVKVPAPEPERAHEPDGKFKADDPTTPENEAYVGGKGPEAPAEEKAETPAPAPKPAPKKRKRAPARKK